MVSWGGEERTGGVSSTTADEFGQGFPCSPPGGGRAALTHILSVWHHRAAFGDEPRWVPGNQTRSAPHRRCAREGKVGQEEDALRPRIPAPSQPVSLCQHSPSPNPAKSSAPKYTAALSREQPLGKTYLGRTLFKAIALITYGCASPHSSAAASL